MRAGCAPTAPWSAGDWIYPANPRRRRTSSHRSPLGDVHSCGLLVGGDIVCWGYDDGRATPLPGTFVSLTAGDERVCGIRRDGAVDCWGRGLRDELFLLRLANFSAVSGGR